MKNIFIIPLFLSLFGCTAFDELLYGISKVEAVLSSVEQVQTDANLEEKNAKALSSTEQETTREVGANHSEISSGKQQAQSISNTIGLSTCESVLLWVGIAFVFFFIGGMMPQFDFMRRLTDGNDGSFDKILDKLENFGRELHHISAVLVELKSENSDRDYRIDLAEGKIESMGKQLKMAIDEYQARKKLGIWVGYLVAGMAVIAGVGMWYIEHQRDLNIEREKYALSIPSPEQQK